MTRDELVRTIYQAFTSPPPRPDDLIEPGSDDGDARDVRRALRNRRWTAVPRSVPIDERSALSWFTPIAMCHYLPLWLVASLDDGTVCFWTVSSLARPADRPTARRHFEFLTPAERAAVVQFLRWVAETDPSERDGALKALSWWSPEPRT